MLKPDDIATLPSTDVSKVSALFSVASSSISPIPVGTAISSSTESIVSVKLDSSILGILYNVLGSTPFFKAS